ncbi:conserved hypothetical protein [Hyella patelloides LEGE 07179]|uniref:DUF72 domain-containing protein n=1 Tax=Hyella patelloides LEGE 07179 TaxID=945734 RepID=A0A563W1R2_9CYAN|nr:DUF72 domain-containing protein [Hyella patelloides]VEP17628.1 conserved hypothetical protein [Hyella patelloides LEGE 07179]
MIPPKLYLGCAVWSYKGWVGNFYPAKTKSGDFLNLYSQQFNTVEGNTTFYAVPQPNTVTKWANETTKEFKFCPKFPKTITHKGLLQPKIAQGLSFLKIMSGLEDKLGVVFAQLPPSYSPQYIKDLREFLIAFKKHDIAVEVRHPDWFVSPYKEQLNQMLLELNIARVLLDTRPIYNCNNDPQVNSQRRKPNVPLQPVVTNNYALVRFISNPEAEYNQAYLAQWAIQVSDWLKIGKTVYFFVHCPVEEKSPNTANYFKDLLEKQGVSIEQRSTNAINTATQLNLFEI